MPKRICVGISTYRDRGHLELLLQSIRWYTYKDDPDFDLVVCDDGTRTVDPANYERTKEVCGRYGAILIEHDQNLGIPSAWNHLAESLGGESEIQIILNDDLLMPPNWLRTMVHFLDANKDCPHVGSAFWLPLQPCQMETMKFIIDKLGHTIFRMTDQATGESLSHIPPNQRSVDTHGGRWKEGHGLGRVMCMAGCCFGFRREVWKRVGPFDERLTSFHEESDWGTRCASMGMASIALPYPSPYHAHGQTFAANPELQASSRMVASRKLYREIWNVPDSVGASEYFNYMNRKYMPQIPAITLKYLAPDYSLPPEQRQLVGGEFVQTPTLVEKTQTLGSMEGVPA